MNITTEWKIEALPDPKNSRLFICTYLDGKNVGITVALSGPTEDVVAYTEGRMTLEEIDKKWRTERWR